jgi:hypothetical protein
MPTRLDGDILQRHDGRHTVGILLAFMPFIAFAVVDTLAGSLAGLGAGAIVSLSLLAHTTLIERKRAKILEVGTALLFVGLALYAIAAKPPWTIAGVRLRVDAGLLAIVLASLAIGRPFTLQYARERVAPELQDSPAFRRTNVVITSVWALAFAVIVAADALFAFAPATPRAVGIAATVVALVGAFKFTAWYPEHGGR